MVKGKFTGVGIGPGDPDLVSFKAVNTIKTADVICTPRSKNKGESIAYEIMKKWCKGKKIIDMSYSMSDNFQERNIFWRTHARKIVLLCTQGQSVAFLTLGDPGLYSTFAYVVRLIRESDPSIPVEIIPGVMSVSACAAAAGQSLAQAEETLTIQPCSQILDKRALWWKSFDCVVVMKIGKKLPCLVKRLQKLSLLEHAALVTRAGFENCSIVRGNDLLSCDEQQGYLATMIVKAGLRGESGF